MFLCKFVELSLVLLEELVSKRRSRLYRKSLKLRISFLSYPTASFSLDCDDIRIYHIEFGVLVLSKFSTDVNSSNT